MFNYGATIPNYKSSSGSLHTVRRLRQISLSKKRNNDDCNASATLDDKEDDKDEDDKEDDREDNKEDDFSYLWSISKPKHLLSYDWQSLRDEEAAIEKYLNNSDN